MLKTILKFQNEDVFDLDQVFLLCDFKRQVLVTVLVAASLAPLGKNFNSAIFAEL